MKKKYFRNTPPLSPLFPDLESQERIVRWMHGLMGKQDRAKPETCLEELAKYVSQKEGRIYSVDDIILIYGLVTNGKLKTEVKVAQEVSYEWIRKKTREIRERNAFSKAFHHNQLEEEIAEREREELYKLAKRRRMSF